VSQSHTVFHRMALGFDTRIPHHFGTSHLLIWANHWMPLSLNTQTSGAMPWPPSITTFAYKQQWIPWKLAATETVTYRRQHANRMKLSAGPMPEHVVSKTSTKPNSCGFQHQLRATMETNHYQPYYCYGCMSALWSNAHTAGYCVCDILFSFVPLCFLLPPFRGCHL
jgi:hypothetical protein